MNIHMYAYIKCRESEGKFRNTYFMQAANFRIYCDRPCTHWAGITPVSTVWMGDCLLN